MVGLDARAAFAEVVPEARALVARLLAEEPLPLAELRRQVVAYRKTLAAAVAREERIDALLVEDMIDGCLALLDEAAAEPDAPDAVEARRILHVACRYFVLEEDGEGDFDSLLGFDDDASVYNAAARALDRDDLCVVP